MRINQILLAASCCAALSANAESISREDMAVLRSGMPVAISMGVPTCAVGNRNPTAHLQYLDAVLRRHFSGDVPEAIVQAELAAVKKIRAQWTQKPTMNQL